MYEPFYWCPFCRHKSRSEQACRQCLDRLQWYKAGRGNVTLTIEVTPHNRATIEYFCGVKPDPEPSRHCSECGIGTCDAGESRCQKCREPESKEQQPMTLDRAVIVLNYHAHQGFDNWAKQDDEMKRVLAYSLPRADGDWEWFFTEFEAIAIAEKYEREASDG